MMAPLTALVGLTAAGLVTGLTMAYPLIINAHFTEQQGAKVEPQAASANLSVAQRLTLWNRTYSLGAACIPVLDMVAVASFVTFVQIGGTAPIKIRAATLSPNTAPSSFSVDTLIYAASGMLLFHIPFTLLVIKPVNDKLMALRRTANRGESVEEGKVNSLLSTWKALHNVRVTAALGGLVTALYAMIPV